MGWEEKDPFKYYPERGLYYHMVWPEVYCGSQPQTSEDIDALGSLLGPKGTILSLQQDKDLAYWHVDLTQLQKRASRNNLTYLRQPVMQISNFTKF